MCTVSRDLEPLLVTLPSEEEKVFDDRFSVFGSFVVEVRPLQGLTLGATVDTWEEQKEPVHPRLCCHVEAGALPMIFAKKLSFLVG